MEQSAALRCGQHRQRIGRAGRAQVRPLQRVDGDVHLRIGSDDAVRLADFFADIEHRRFVALALADDDGAVDRNRVHFLPHGLDGDLIRLVTVALSHRVRARNRRLLDDTQKVQRQIGIEQRWLVHRGLFRSRRGHRVSHAGKSQRVGLSVRYPSR